MKSYSMSVDGKSIQALFSFDVLNPANGEPFARVPAANLHDLNGAVDAARVAFKSWSKVPDIERKEAIRSLASVIEENRFELIELITRETGKPIIGLNGVGATMEVSASIAWAKYTAELDLPFEVIQDDSNVRIEVHRKPIGVVGSITPWNWPLMIAIWHILPALRVGNTVVIKPSELTPVTTLKFVELANSILPPGVLNVISAERESGVGNAMAKHEDINKIVFTGSTSSGRQIMANSAGNLKRLTLELGGNDAGIVLPDVDPKAVAHKLFSAAFHNNGQTCACLKRLYVHESIYEQMCAELARLASNVIVGNGLMLDTQLGPIQNQKQLNYIADLVEVARAEGARVLSGGEKLINNGYFYKPTILADVADGMRVVDEEQFGPVLPVISYSDIDEIIELANNNPNGLGGSVWSNDLSRATELALRLECGFVWVNEHGALQPNAPFGGIKQSGVGVEFGHYGLEEYTNIQTLKIMKS